MNKQYNFFKVGLFSIIALAILLFLLIGLGAGSFLKKSVYVETFFNESVQGLQIGSNVKYLGINIGRVEEIKPLDEVYPSVDKNPSANRYIYTKIAITDVDFATKHFIKSLPGQIKAGLRAQLQPEGVTGASNLNLTFLSPKTNPAILKQDNIKHKFTYIPSATSTISRFTDAVSDLFEKIKKSDVLPLIGNANKLTMTANQAIAHANMPGLSKDTRASLLALTGTAKKYKELANKLMTLMSKKQVNETVDNMAVLSNTLKKTTMMANQTLLQMQTMLKSTNQILSSFKVNEQTLLANAKEASNNIKTLTNNAKAYPAQLIFSKPPPHIDPSKL